MLCRQSHPTISLCSGLKGYLPHMRPSNSVHPCHNNRSPPGYILLAAFLVLSPAPQSPDNCVDSRADRALWLGHTADDFIHLVKAKLCPLIAATASGLLLDATCQISQSVLLSGMRSRRHRYGITTPRAQTSPGGPRPVWELSMNSGGTYPGVPAVCVSAAEARVLSLLSPSTAP